MRVATGPALPSGTAYRGVVVGASSGGLEALLAMLSPLDASFGLPILLVQHLHRTDEGRFALHLKERLALPVSEVTDKASIEPGRILVAPANYHLLVERHGACALSVDPRVCWARPSIDVLFESAASAWGTATIGVILSGANEDGAEGCRMIAASGGLCLAQDPDTAEAPVMPSAAIARAHIEQKLSPLEIGEALVRLARREPARLAAAPAREMEHR